eukprot:scaffold174189_cov37-Cyclotella_meneghiniana.AAC.2
MNALDSESGNRDSSSVSWAGTRLLGSGYSGESTVLSGGGSSRKSSGGTGWRVPRLASRRWMLARAFEMTRPSCWSWRAYSLGVGAVSRWWPGVHFGGAGGVTAEGERMMVGVLTKEEVVEHGTPASKRADCEGDEYHLLVEELFGDADVARYKLTNGVNHTATRKFMLLFLGWLAWFLVVLVAMDEEARSPQKRVRSHF